MFAGTQLLLLIATQGSSARGCIDSAIMCVCLSEKTGKGTESEQNRMGRPCQTQAKEGRLPLVHPTQLGTRSNAPIKVSKRQPELESTQASFSAGIKSQPPSKKRSTGGAPGGWPRSASAAGSPRPAGPPSSQSLLDPPAPGVPGPFIPPASQGSCLQPRLKAVPSEPAPIPA